MNAQPSVNFAYLAHHDARLVALATQAEEVFASDPPSQLCPGEVLLDEPLREVFAVMTTEQRWAFLNRRARPFRDLVDSFTTTVRTARIGEEIVKVPMLAGAWPFADLFPVDEIAKCVVNAIEIAVALGACCVPFLEEAIPRAKGRNRRVLRTMLAKLSA